MLDATAELYALHIADGRRPVFTVDAHLHQTYGHEAAMCDDVLARRVTPDEATCR